MDCIDILETGRSERGLLVFSVDAKELDFKDGGDHVG